MDGWWSGQDVATNGADRAGWSGEGRVLVTGCAGFIGSHLSERLVEIGCDVIGVDCFTDYYARESKERNLERLRAHRRFSFQPTDLAEDDLAGLLEGVSAIFHLAGQPGVRLSFGEGFGTYLRHNVLATQRLLEAAIGPELRAFTYASSSSVYGDTPQYPTLETSERRPVSPYGLTKLAAEELAGVYHRDFGVPTVGMRYFTVYGPRQRPDMAFSRFLRSALDGEPLLVLGDGRQIRDFTYVSDVVEGTIAAARHGRPGTVYNLGAEAPVDLCSVFDLIAELVERPLVLDRRPALVGDAVRTGCDGELARRELGFAPSVALRDGLAAQLRWVASERVEPSIPGLDPGLAGRARMTPMQPGGPAYRAAKRTLDIVVAGLLLFGLAPALGLIAVLIYAEDPKAGVLFRQRRCGLGGRTFQLLKFRTMVRDADGLKEQLRERSVVAWPDFRLVDDPRVTRLGRVLRKTSIDELPQLVNVLRGEMTLVGPRPTSFAVDTYALWQTGRLDFRPGLSGPWQVDGRSSMDFVERCRLEISFFARPSLRRELWLLVRTVGTVVRRTGVA